MNQDNQIKLLNDLGERFSVHRSEHAGKKLIVYSRELKELVRLAVELGVSISKVAELCKVSNASVRDWIKRQGQTRLAVKKLELEERRAESLTEYARLRISDRLVIEIPVSSLLRELSVIAGYQ